jgi:catechol 2,3-dioxygenase-like lactoylglutathione lyase family enzyme
MAVAKVVGLDHVVFRCADIEKSLMFFTDQLGLEAERVDDWRRGEIIDLFGGGPNGTNVDHVCLVIEPADLDAIARSFPDAQRADHLFGAQGYASSVYIHDPDGNTIELRSYA